MKEKSTLIISGMHCASCAINIEDSLKKLRAETALSQIISAQQSKALIQRIADRVAAYFVPIVVMIALSTFVVWYFLMNHFLFALTTLVSVLVVACPCAMGIATPTAVTVGLGKGAENGILIKEA